MTGTEIGNDGAAVTAVERGRFAERRSAVSPRLIRTFRKDRRTLWQYRALPFKMQLMEIFFFPRISGCVPCSGGFSFPFLSLHEKRPWEVLRASFSPFYFEGE